MCVGWYKATCEAYVSWHKAPAECRAALVFQEKLIKPVISDRGNEKEGKVMMWVK